MCHCQVFPSTATKLGERGRALPLVLAPDRDAAVGDLDYRDAVVCGLAAVVPEGVFAEAALRALVERDGVKTHKRPRRQRREVRPQLVATDVVLDVGRLRVRRVLGEARQPELRVLR